jgi:hypothetical protein
VISIAKQSIKTIDIKKKNWHLVKLTNYNRIVDIGESMLEAIQDFFSSSYDEINDDGWVSYLFNLKHHPVRTSIFAAIALLVIAALIKSMLDGSLFLFLGAVLLFCWLFFKVFPHN